MHEEMPVEIASIMDGVLKEVQETVEAIADADEQALDTVEKLQEASLEDQAVFVVRLLLNYLDEDTRREILNDYTVKD